MLPPVNDVERVEIADGARYLGCVEPCSRLRKTPLSLQVEEQLQKGGWTDGAWRGWRDKVTWRGERRTG